MDFKDHKIRKIVTFSCFETIREEYNENYFFQN